MRKLRRRERPRLGRPRQRTFPGVGRDEVDGDAEHEDRSHGDDAVVAAPGGTDGDERHRRARQPEPPHEHAPRHVEARVAARRSRGDGICGRLGRPGGRRFLERPGRDLPEPAGAREGHARGQALDQGRPERGRQAGRHRPLAVHPARHRPVADGGLAPNRQRRRDDRRHRADRRRRHDALPRERRSLEISRPRAGRPAGRGAQGDRPADEDRAHQLGPGARLGRQGRPGAAGPRGSDGDDPGPDDERRHEPSASTTSAPRWTSRSRPATR